MIEELRQYWEVPAVAHFCSLFRQVFDLVDFDIEDFEEALVSDTEAACEGGRSSTIVDLLVGLLRGCMGKKDITLLNYNQFLHDYLHFVWVLPGFGPNPLGVVREKANFHLLPLYAKVKILHTLCELRLERPDVEQLTRNLSGDSLRIQPLGFDEAGSTYWYFYGTRLYKEDPAPKQSPKSRSPKKAGSSSTFRLGINSTSQNGNEELLRKGPGTVDAVQKNKRKRVTRDSWAPKKRGRPPTKKNVSVVETKRNDEDDEDDEDDDDDDDDDTKSESATPAVSESEAECSQRAGSDLKITIKLRGAPRKKASLDVTRDTTDSVQSSPVSAGQKKEIAGGELRDLMMRIYSNDDEDDEAKNVVSDGEFVVGEREPNNDQSKSVIADEANNSIACQDKKESARSNVKRTAIEPTPAEEAIANNNSQAPSLLTPDSEANVKSDESAVLHDGSPPWQQKLLTPLPDSKRWHLFCATIEDWKALNEKCKQSRAAVEKELHQILEEEFLEAIEQLFAQKERDRQKKLADLAPRRSSDRLELKKLQREQDEKLLNQREKEERDRLAHIEAERKQRQMREDREKRFREREKDMERKEKLHQKKREERTKRLELRQRRQELLAAGVDIPAELSAGFMSPEEIGELDREIEREHMFGQLEKVLHAVLVHADSWPFEEPVDEEIAPGYRDMIKTPMDLGIMESKLNRQEYANKLEFINDMNLMFMNCLEYNGLESDYTKIAQRLERVFIKAWKKHFPLTELHETNSRIQKEEIECVKNLGVLDRKIQEEIEGIPSEEENPDVTAAAEAVRNYISESRSKNIPNILQRQYNQPINAERVRSMIAASAASRRTPGNPVPVILSKPVGTASPLTRAAPGLAASVQPKPLQVVARNVSANSTPRFTIAGSPVSFVQLPPQTTLRMVAAQPTSTGFTLQPFAAANLGSTTPVQATESTTYGTAMQMANITNRSTSIQARPSAIILTPDLQGKILQAVRASSVVSPRPSVLVASGGVGPTSLGSATVLRLPSGAATLPSTPGLASSVTSVQQHATSAASAKPVAAPLPAQSDQLDGNDGKHLYVQRGKDGDFYLMERLTSGQVTLKGRVNLQPSQMAKLNDHLHDKQQQQTFTSSSSATVPVSQSGGSGGKPVCSVTPQPQLASRPPGLTTLSTASSPSCGTMQPATAVVGQPQMLFVSTSGQAPLGSFLMASPTGTSTNAASSSFVLASGSQQPVQVLQVMLPQIVVNAPGQQQLIVQHSHADTSAVDDSFQTVNMENDVVRLS